MAINFPFGPVARQVYNVSPGLSYWFKDGLWQRCPAITALPKNYIMNSAMTVSQQNGETALEALSTYPADQWSAHATGFLDSETGKTTSTEARIHLKATSGKSVLSAGDYMLLMQAIEGYRIADLKWGSPDAVDLMLRFDAYTNQAGTYSFALRNSALTRSYTNTFSMPLNAWTTVSMPIPACTDGVWENASAWAMHLNISFACGTTYLTAPGAWTTGNYLGATGMTNGAAVTNNTFYLRAVGLYADPYKTKVAPQYNTPDHHREQRACQRYWYRGFGFGGMGGARLGMRHPAPMRVAPAMTVRGAPRVFDGATTVSLNSISTSYNNYMAVEFDASVGAGLTAGYKGKMYYQDDNQYIEVSAR